MRYSVLFILYLSFLQPTYSQTDIITIVGAIQDAKTKEAIPYANITLKDAATGSASNSEGDFIFKLLPKTSDTLVFSCIGYNTRKIAVADLKNSGTVYMTPSILELPELTITARSGLHILNEVIAKIPQNYDTTATGYTGFYQENIWLGDVELSFLEAAIDVYRPFKTEKKLNDQVKILKGRKKQLDFSKDPQLYYWLGGVSNGIRGSLSEDMVKYHGAKYSPLRASNFKYYTYEHVETIKNGDQRFIVLAVEPKTKPNKAIMRMRLFIDENSMAIAKYNFQLTERGIALASRKDKHIGYTIMTKVVHATLDYYKFEYTVSYQQNNGKWYLNRVNRHWEIHVDSKRRNWDNHLWQANMNLIMTDLKKDATPITEGNIGGSQTPLTTIMGNNFNDEFWENYNFIKSEETPLLSKDSLKTTPKDTVQIIKRYSNRENGFMRTDTLRGKLTPLRSCYDVTFYHLDVALDLDKHSIKGNTVIRFRVQQPFRRFQIDLYANMKIEKILFGQKELVFTREYDAVYVDFPTELKQGTENSIKVYYEGVPQVPDFTIPMHGGVLWDRDSLGNVWAQMVCQGSGASLWWPNKDHLSDEPDSVKIWITVPKEYTEISNGVLMQKTPMPGNQLRYEWHVSYPINNYNVTFAVGKYHHWQSQYITSDTLQLNFYAMPYHKQIAQTLFASAPEMLKIFETNYGKYPFARDGFTLVESPYPMEHQSGVCVGKLSESSIPENRLMWHEAAHEWWGNSISCTDMADLWIHEAFATYAELEVIEAKYGKERIAEITGEEANAVHNDEPIVGVYDVNHIHYDIGDMYSKGSLMLHTFRSMLNNDAQWRGLLLGIQNRFRYSTVTTKALIQFINEYLKTDYTWFFEQYLFHTTLPTLKIMLTETDKNLIMKYKWEADVEKFNMPIKITKAVEKFDWIYPAGEWKSITLKDMALVDFEVDEENFYINVDLEEN